ncbi:MAG: MarR family winged helix-turn-helix transcriptional regulator [Solirubrobacteraceae bacterium]
MNDPVNQVGVDELRSDGRCVVDGHAISYGARGRTALLVVRIGSVLDELADDRLADAGVNAREYAILAILSSDGPGSQLELATLLGKAPGVIVGVVDALQERGLVMRARDPDDRRRSRVTLTEAGSSALARADELAAATLGDVLGGLSAGQLQQLDELLARGLGLDGA